MILFLVIFIAVATLAVDLAAKGSRGQDLQNASDAAALAGVAEYQSQIVAGADSATAAAEAERVVNEILEQNGIDPTLGNITVDIAIVEEEDGENFGTRLAVTITDSDPDQFLPNDLLGSVIKAGDSSLERTATAEFLLCKLECSLVVTIPAPFEAISARGNGDGYKPIEVGRRLFALNHNSRARNIVCVDRDTREQCWPDSVFRPAYASNYDDRNPEMPHTAVVNDIIYWTATDDSNGLRLFCFIAANEVDVPCPNSWSLDPNLTRFDEDQPGNLLVDDKDENRGGGTFAYNDKVYVFSDNHRLHCYDPAIDSTCSGFARRGNPTALDAFPAGSPVDGNHGSSIDRVIDEAGGRVYSTLHIPFAQEGIECSSEVVPGQLGGERVVIVNKETGRYLASDFPDFVYAADTGSDERMWWDVDALSAEIHTFQSAWHGEYLDSSPFASTDDFPGPDDEWEVTIAGAGGNAYHIDRANIDGVGGLFDDDGSIIEEAPAVTTFAEWNFFPWQCGIDPNLSDTTPEHFESGTWLHCYDLDEIRPCDDFTVRGVGSDPIDEPSPIHLDGTRFSGRLWFYYSPAPGESEPIIQGVCSSGYGQWYAPGSTNMLQSDLEVNCVDLTGAFSSSQTLAMNAVRADIVNHTGRSPAAWGDPHWNATENRLLYPTEHGTPYIVCYDFDTSLACPGISQSITDENNVTWRTEDYGFVSDGNCVYALGHTAFFWAFKASDVGEQCDPEPARTTVERCDCGDGEFAWGVLDFSEVDMDRFEAFGVRILTDEDNPQPIFPSDGSYHSIKPGGASSQISLDDLSDGFAPGTESVLVEIAVEGSIAEDEETLGEFEIRFPQRPKLVN